MKRFLSRLRITFLLSLLVPAAPGETVGAVQLGVVDPSVEQYGAMLNVCASLANMPTIRGKSLKPEESTLNQNDPLKCVEELVAGIGKLGLGPVSERNLRRLGVAASLYVKKMQGWETVADDTARLRELNVFEKYGEIETQSALLFNAVEVISAEAMEPVLEDFEHKAHAAGIYTSHLGFIGFLGQGRMYRSAAEIVRGYGTYASGVWSQQRIGRTPGGNLSVQARSTAVSATQDAIDKVIYNSATVLASDCEGSYKRLRSVPAKPEAAATSVEITATDGKKVVGTVELSGGSSVVNISYDEADRLDDPQRNGEGRTEVHLFMGLSAYVPKGLTRIATPFGETRLGKYVVWTSYDPKKGPVAPIEITYDEWKAVLPLVDSADLDRTLGCTGSTTFNPTFFFGLLYNPEVLMEVSGPGGVRKVPMHEQISPVRLAQDIKKLAAGKLGRHPGYLRVLIAEANSWVTKYRDQLTSARSLHYYARRLGRSGNEGVYSFLKTLREKSRFPESVDMMLSYFSRIEMFLPGRGPWLWSMEAGAESPALAKARLESARTDEFIDSIYRTFRKPGSSRHFWYPNFAVESSGSRYEGFESAYLVAREFKTRLLRVVGSTERAKEEGIAPDERERRVETMTGDMWTLNRQLWVMECFQMQIGYRLTKADVPWFQEHAGGYHLRELVTGNDDFWKFSNVCPIGLARSVEVTKSGNRPATGVECGWNISATALAIAPKVLLTGCPALQEGDSYPRYASRVESWIGESQTRSFRYQEWMLYGDTAANLALTLASGGIASSAQLGIRYLGQRAVTAAAKSALTAAVSRALLFAAENLVASAAFSLSMRAGGLLVGRIPYDPKLTVGQNLRQLGIEVAIGGLVFSGFSAVRKIDSVAKAGAGALVVKVNAPAFIKTLLPAAKAATTVGLETAYLVHAAEGALQLKKAIADASGMTHTKKCLEFVERSRKNDTEVYEALLIVLAFRSLHLGEYGEMSVRFDPN